MTDSNGPIPTDNVSMAKIVYFMFMIAIALGPLGIVGVIIAYVYHDNAPDWLRTHFRFQIRTFWIGAVYLAVGSILTLLLIGYLVLLFWAVWLVIRCVKGIQTLDSDEPITNVERWSF